MTTKNSNRRKRYILAFGITFLIALLVLIIGIVKTATFNNTQHHKEFSGEKLFDTEVGKFERVTVKAVPRDSTWTKVFDFDNKGLSEHNFQAYTYDFNINNNTKDVLSEFSFRLSFSQDVYLSSAWNGALEFHQQVKGGEVVATIPDLRDYKPEEYDLKTYTVDGENLVALETGDYLNYIPSSSTNAMEIPIEPEEGTTPGIILYAPIGKSLEASTLELSYKFHRRVTSEPLFWLAMVGFLLWLIALVIVVVTSMQIRKYNERHERDNEIINESIETFTGFIDAKDPYTNGHSKRVALYTRRIAEEMGYEGEELDRIYYVGLLHDCGKIGVPDNILGKPGKLTEEEFEIIKSHTLRGGDILSHFKSLKNVEEGALYHHERYDGKGYPERRAGKDIPLIARIICVADSFDAMNSNRVYRKKLTKEKIIRELEDNKGTQFDPEIADIMLRLLREGKITFEI